MPEQTPMVDFSNLEKVLDKLSEFVKNNHNKWELKIARETNCYTLEGKIDDITRRWSREDNPKDKLQSAEQAVRDMIEYFIIEGLRIVRKKIDD